MQGLRGMHGGSPNHFQRVEPGLLHQFQLVDVAEAPCVVDERRIVTGGDATAHFFVVVEQAEPELVELAPLNLVVERPVEEVGPVIVAVGTIEVVECGERVLVMPVGVPHAHHVTAGSIRRHRGIKDGAQLGVGSEVLVPLRGAGFVGFVVQTSHLRKAVVLVVVVHLGRPWLNFEVLQQRFEVTVEMCHRAQAELRGGECVHLRDTALFEVGGGTQPEFLRLVEQGRHDGWRVGDEFHAVHAVLLAPAHPLTCHLGRGDRAARPAISRTLVVEDAGGDDRVGVGAGLLRCGVRLGTEFDAATGRDAVGHPQLERVLGLGRLRRTAHMHVQVHKTRQQIHARAVDLVLRGGWTIRAQRHAWCAGTPNGCDAIVLDDDVHRAERRRSGAVDDHDAANHQCLERADPFIGPPVWRGHNAARAGGCWGLLGGNQSRGEDRGQKEQGGALGHGAYCSRPTAHPLAARVPPAHPSVTTRLRPWR